MEQWGDTMSVSSKHSSIMNKFQKLIPKYCLITTQADTGVYKNKSFIFPQISAGAIEKERFKNIDTTFSEDAVKITILISKIQEVRDKTDTVSAPVFGYKRFNSTVSYRGVRYIIKHEVQNEMNTTLSLYLDTKN